MSSAPSSKSRPLTSDEVLRLRSIFARVFGPHYSIVPARGYTRVSLNSVPTMRERPSDVLPNAEKLRAELARNIGLKDLILLGDPYWLTARHPDARHGSISFAFLDPDGSRLKDMIRNPPHMFGNRTSKVRRYESRPLISQCDRCWSLGHDSDRCRPKDVVVCPLCGGAHAKDVHHKKCPNVSKHTEVYCTCPPVCINCRCERALSSSCPLRSKFRSPTTRTGDSSDEEKNGAEAMLTDGEANAKSPIVTPTPSL